MRIEQTVQVEILGVRRRYTYCWEFDPAKGEKPLMVGDRVAIPGNMVNEEGGAATVAALGSDYNGPMKRILSRLADRPPAEDDMWAGEDVI